MWISSGGSSVRTVRNGTPDCGIARRNRSCPISRSPGWQVLGGDETETSLCCALIHDPDLLILDEPTTGVDPLSRRQFWELDRPHQRTATGLTVIVATAYMEEAERFSWLVDDGRRPDTRRRLPGEPKAQTGTDDARADFINLLPGRGGALRHRGRGDPAGCAGPPHRSNRAYKKIRRLRCCEQRELQNRAWRNLWLFGLERMRQEHNDEDAHRSAAGDEGEARLFGPAGCERHGNARAHRLHVAGLFALRRTHGATEPGFACPSVPHPRGPAAARIRNPRTVWNSTLFDELPKLPLGVRQRLRLPSPSSTSRRSSSSMSPLRASIRWPGSSSGGT